MKKIMLVTSDAWSLVRLDKRTTVQAYYFINYWISDIENSTKLPVCIFHINGCDFFVDANLAKILRSFQQTVYFKGGLISELSILIFFSTKLSGIDPYEKHIDYPGGHAWGHVFMACSKLEVMAIYVPSKTGLWE